MRWFAFGAVVLALCVVLYLVLTRSHNQDEAQRERPVTTNSATDSAAFHKNTKSTSAPAGDASQQRDQAPEHGGGMRVESTRPQSPASGTGLPATIEEAIASNPALAKDLACRNEQARFDMDHQLRMIAGIRDCLAGRTKSTGRIEFMLHFDNDPATRRAVGTTIDPLSSELTPEDDRILLECLRAFHVGSLLLNSEKYGKTNARHRASSISLPLEDSYIYTMVREGSYTAGTSFGCEVP